jgi:uncharacterized repeat protein (TIGR01451 family)
MGLTFSKTVNNTTPIVGEIVTFTIQLANPEGVPNTVSIEDTIPPELALITVANTKGDLLVAGPFFKVSNFTLLPNETLTITATATVLEPGLITNTAILKLNDTEVTSTSVTLVASQAIPCLHPHTLVNTKKGAIAISEIKAGDYVTDYMGKEIPVLFNMRFGKTRDFIRIEKDTLGKNVPSADLIIRKRHHILLNGKSIDPARLKKRYSGVKKISLEESVPVWSLCTEKRTFVMMEGVPVATWAQSEIESQTKFKYSKF